MTVNDALTRIKAIHETKSHDYAKADNIFSNFEFAAGIADEFPAGPDKVFSAIMGIKLARMAELLAENKTPKHESVDESFLDLCTYGVLWWTWYSTQQTDDDQYGWGV